MDDKRKLTVTQGDITLLPLDGGAIVNPSNTGMILGSGVGEAITRRAGPFIQQTLHMKRSTLDGNRLEPGEAVETEAGQLSAEYLIHVSILGANEIDKRLISNCILNAYTLADDLEVGVLAFPPLGVDLAQFPLQDFMDLFARITVEELPRADHLEHVILCCEDEHDFEDTAEYCQTHSEDLPESIELEISESGLGASLM
ncbi:MAG: macro domain-containing protein [Bradymonadaceae bacterium]